MSEQHAEEHGNMTTSRLNALRAAVLGANDGIVSVAGIVVGVAGATTSLSAIFTAGIAGLVAGGLSMAAGEYVSVSSQRDTEKAMLSKEKMELKTYPKAEKAELTQLYVDKGLTPDTARRVADELTAHDAFAAHAEVELKIDPDDLNNPWHAALASSASFLSGAIIPFIAILVAPKSHRVLITFIAVLVALVLTGLLSAKVSGVRPAKATARVVIGGAVAMIITYAIGSLVGQHNL